MIRRSIFGISLATRPARRRFLAVFWLAELAILLALFQLHIPGSSDLGRTLIPLFLALTAANVLPLVLGGISVGGAVAYYEGRPFHLSPEARARLAANPEKERLVGQFLDKAKPCDEYQAHLRDWAYHRAHGLLGWILFASVIAFLIVSGISLPLLARFGVVLLELLLVASMSLPQSLILWNQPDMETAQ